MVENFTIEHKMISAAVFCHGLVGIVAQIENFKSHMAEDTISQIYQALVIGTTMVQPVQC
jgi:hypothetical protein